MFGKFPLLLKNTPENLDTVSIGLALEPIQMVSMNDVNDLINKLVAIGAATKDVETNNLYGKTNPNILAQELLLSNDGKTYLRSDICKLSMETRKLLPIYFISVGKNHEIYINSACDIDNERKDLAVNQLLATALCQLDLKTGRLLDNFQFPELNGSFDNAIAFINTAFEDLVWITCQNEIRRNNQRYDIKHKDYTNSYVDTLNKYKEFFATKQSQLKKFTDYMDKLSKESALLNKIKDKNLSPEELQKQVQIQLSDEQRHQTMQNWQKLQNNKLYIDQSKLDLGLVAMYLTVCCGIGGAPLIYGGLATYYALSVYRGVKRHDFDQQQKKMPERLNFITSQAPTINYLTNAVKTDHEQLGVKISAIDNELNIVQSTKSTITKITETTYKYVDKIKGVSSYFLWKKETPPTTANIQPTVSEPDDTVSEPDDEVVVTGTNQNGGNTSSVIIEDITDSEETVKFTSKKL